MNKTSLDQSDMPQYPQDSTISFKYGVGLSVGVLLFIVIITYSSYACVRSSAPRRDYATSSSTSSAAAAEQHLGLDESTLLNFPQLLYSQVKHHGSSAASGCSICLADYKDADLLRLLPDCGHLFHLNCVDLWLRLNPTCPICRNSPMPTPMATPAAEVAPLRVLAAV